MIWAALIFYGVLTVDLWTDLRRYFSGKKINHFRGFLLRIVGLLPSVYLLPHDRLTGAGLEGILYLILFNGIFGVFIGRGWFYLGDSWTDKLIKKTGIWSFVFQYAFLIILTLIYFL